MMVAEKLNPKQREVRSQERGGRGRGGRGGRNGGRGRGRGGQQGQRDGSEQQSESSQNSSKYWVEPGIWKQLPTEVKAAITTARRQQNATREITAASTTATHYDNTDLSVVTQDERSQVPTLRSIMASSAQNPTNPSNSSQKREYNLSAIERRQIRFSTFSVHANSNLCLIDGGSNNGLAGSGMRLLESEISGE